MLPLFEQVYRQLSHVFRYEAHPVGTTPAARFCSDVTSRDRLLRIELA
jgi:hypothetical protein